MPILTSFSYLDHAGKIFRNFYPKSPGYPERDGIQVNHCKSPVCPNYGVAAGQSSVVATISYILDSRNKGISLHLHICGVEFPLQEQPRRRGEVERMASYLLHSNAVCCRNEACANHTDQVPIGTAGAYARSAKPRAVTPDGA